MNALFVDGDGTLGLYNVTTRNNGPRLERATGGVLYREAMFGPWPSIVLAPGATVGIPFWTPCVCQEITVSGALR